MVSTATIQMIVELNLCYEHHYLQTSNFDRFPARHVEILVGGPSTQQAGQIRRCDLVNINFLGLRIPVMRESTRV